MVASNRDTTQMSIAAVSPTRHLLSDSCHCIYHQWGPGGPRERERDRLSSKSRSGFPNNTALPSPGEIGGHLCALQPWSLCGTCTPESWTPTLPALPGSPHPLRRLSRTKMPLAAAASSPASPSSPSPALCRPGSQPVVGRRKGISHRPAALRFLSV